jgi:hypothetical protein
MMATVAIDAELRIRAVTITFTPAGTFDKAILIADLVDDTGNVIGSPKAKAYTAAEAGALGVTGAQANAFKAATIILKDDYQITVLGA